VNKINNPANHFDLILMDIILPHLDGVSATVCIREIRPHIPIIAMTSNIRTDDIDMYFRYGKSRTPLIFYGSDDSRHERCPAETIH
jgi:osomolarity two-component system response regulator SKN7